MPFKDREDYKAYQRARYPAYYDKHRKRLLEEKRLAYQEYVRLGFRYRNVEGKKRWIPPDECQGEV